jgi:signal transduction histidine kinase
MIAPSISGSDSDEQLKLILVEDSSGNAELLYRRLEKSGIAFHLQSAETEEEFRAALLSPVDLIVSDFTSLRFSATRALEILQSLKLEIPHIIISGSINEQTAITAMQGLEIARMHIQLRIKRDDLALARTHLEALTIQLLNTQEKERMNLARELHDELGQRLAAIKFNLHHLHDFLDAPEANAVWETVDAEVVSLIHQIRTISVALRPPELEYLGLEPSIRQLLAHQFENTSTSYIFEYAGLPAKLAPAIEITVYRIVQESTTNIVRHANASRVVVEINGGEYGEELELIVRDNGIGFKLTDQWIKRGSDVGNGLLGMKERVELLSGQFEVESSPQQGTRVTAAFRLEQ